MIQILPKKCKFVGCHCVRCGESMGKLYCGVGYDLKINKKTVHVNEIEKMKYCPLERSGK